MHPEQQRSRRVGVEEIVIDRLAETPPNQRRKQQRHTEIEVAAQKQFALGNRSRGFFSTNSQLHIAGCHEALAFQCPALATLGTAAASRRRRSAPNRWMFIGDLGISCNTLSRLCFGNARKKGLSRGMSASLAPSPCPRPPPPPPPPPKLSFPSSPPAQGSSRCPAGAL